MKNTILLIMLTALAAIIFRLTGPYWVFMILKPLTTIIIFAAYLSRGRLRLVSNNLLMCGSLLACLAGDIFLLWSDLFVFGLSAFLLAHIGFIILFIRLHRFTVKAAPTLMLVPIMIIYYWILYPELNDLALPVMVYMSVIVLMGLQGLGISVDRRSQASYWIAFAVLLFMFSDSVIALNRFLIPLEWSPILVLSTYWASITILSLNLVRLEVEK